MINSEKMEVELGTLKISLTSIGGMICWSLFFNVSFTDITLSMTCFKGVDPAMTYKWVLSGSSKHQLIHFHYKLESPSIIYAA